MPWTAVSGNSPGPAFTASYTCSGTTSTVAAVTPVAAIVNPAAGSVSETLAAPSSSTGTCSALAACAPGGTDYLLATLSLPVDAPNSLQGLSDTLSSTFSATQAVAAG